MNVLYVDDEIIARKSMKVIIPWEEHGWTLMETAKDGIEALDFMRINRPDVVISDVKMPIMDGLQMAQIAMEYYPEMKFIFLSGYEDFAYAKEALRLNAVDYLVKPVSPEALIAVLEKTEKLYLRDERINRVVTESFPALRRSYVQSYMDKNFADADDDFFSSLELFLDNGYAATGFVEIDGELTPRIRGKLRTIPDMLALAHPGSFFMLMDTDQLFFIYTASGTATETEFAEKLQSLEDEMTILFQSVTSLKPVYYRGAAVKSLSDISISYRSAVSKRSSRLEDAMYRIRHYVDENYPDAGLSLTGIADRFGINHCYLTSLFKEKFGINLYDYLINVRMEKAGELLRETNLRSYEISDKVGYSNSQYFSLSFKKHFGCTATEYRLKYRKTE